MVDAEGRPVRRRRKVPRAGIGDGDDQEEGEDNTKVPVRDAAKRECPVPKPGGLIGQVLGFSKADGGRPKVPIVRVETVRRRDAADRGTEG